MILSQLWDRIIKGSATMSEREFLQVQLRNFLGSEQRKTMCTAIDYYDGKHDIFNKQRYVVGEGNTRIALQGVPNNQIVDNRFDDLVDQKVNYLLSKPLDINTDDDELDKMFGIQFQRLLKSVGKFATMAGKAYVHPYIGVDGVLKFKMMKPHQVLPFWADEEHTQLDAFIYLYDIEYYTGLETKTIHKVEYYTPEGIQYYIWEMERLLPDPDKENTANFAIADKPYNWERIPLIMFRANEFEQPLIVKVKSLQDALNQLLSNFQDNMEEDIRSTILILQNYDGENLAEFRQNLATYGAIKVRTVDGVNGDVKALKIEVDSSNYQLLINILRKAIIENGRGFDAKDDRMANNPNQMNIMSMYSDIDLDANEMELEFKSSLHELMWFVNTYRGLTNQNAVEEVDFIFNRDLPINEGDTINNCKNSVGIISNETIIANHPWTTDAAEELAKVKKEQSEVTADFVVLNGGEADGE